MLNCYLKNMSNLPNRSLYCLRCRKKTLSTNVQLHEQNRPKGGEGKQYILKGMCTVCNSKQSQFVSGSTNLQLRTGHGVVKTSWCSISLVSNTISLDTRLIGRQLVSYLLPWTFVLWNWIWMLNCFGLFKYFFPWCWRFCSF